MNDPVVAVSVPLDDSNDPAVLEDLIAFLDSFDEMGGGDTPAMKSPEPTATSPTSIGPAAPGRRHGTNRRRTRATAENRARMERYWKEKDELCLLRKQVTYLTSTLEQMKRDPGSLWEVKSASGLRVTVGRVDKPQHTQIDWKHSAVQERELRTRAEEINAQLRSLLRTHLLWRSGLGKQLQVVWPISMEGCRVELLLHRNRAATQEERERTWSAILKQLSQETPALRMTNSFQPVELAEPISASLGHNLSDSAMEWTSSFFVPMESPQRVGRMWWEVLRKQFLAPQTGAKAVMTHHEGAAPRVEKRVAWSVLNDNNQEFRLSTVAMFEVTETHSHWTVAVTSDVFDAARSEVLFRTTTLKVITQARASVSPSCVFRSRYRVHGISSASATPTNCEEVLTQLRNKELAMNAWMDLMRHKDQNMQRILMELCA